MNCIEKAIAMIVNAITGKEFKTLSLLVLTTTKSLKSSITF
jgi:hypothetical protein